ncbi:MAG: substrate-binding domain-containing protein [Candidatus Omnitrophica bacterium]|nr:substrate-binding domain-containing protein [Candidatus Omnitrophota bacterium]
MRSRIALVVISCFLSIAMGIFISRGRQAGPVPAGDDEVLVGLSMDTLKEARWQKDKKFFVEKVRSLGAEVLVQAANSDDTIQVKNVEALISRGVDVLVVVPHNGKAMAKAVRLAHRAGIPVIAYDRLIMDSDLDLYITFDGFKVGQMQARYIVEEVLGDEQNIRIVRIYGSKMDHNAFLFKAGQDDVLEPYIKSGRIEVIHEDWAEDWKPESAKKIVNAAITNHGRDFDAILASNDGTAGGAIQTLKEEGLTGKVAVTGQDAELIACQRIVDGTQAMTIYKPIKDLAYKAAETAVKMARGRPVIAGDGVDNGKVEVPSVLLDVVVVTGENLDETVIADGFHSREEVYR